MKKIIFSTMIASLLAFVGCQNEELVNENSTNNGGEKVILTANIQGATDSRVALTPDTVNGKPIVKVAWNESGETFEVYGSSGASSTFTQIAGTNQFEGTLPESANGEYEVMYGNYDSLDEQDGKLGQSTANDTPVLMGATFDSSSPSITFEHLTAILKPTFMVDDTDIDNSITKIVMSNVAKPTPGDSGNAFNIKTITITPTSSATVLDDNIYIHLFVSQLYVEDYKFTFTVTDKDNKEYTGSLTIPTGKSIEAGKFYIATIALTEVIPYVTFKAASEQTLDLEQTKSPKLDEWGNPVYEDDEETIAVYVPNPYPGSGDDDGSIQYSVGNSNVWKTFTPESQPVPFGGDMGDLHLRGISPNGTLKAQIVFGNNITPVACSGDIRTLVDWKNYETADTRSAIFYGLFENCTVLTSAPELPATDLAEKCYWAMFWGCTSLAEAPKLPATTLANGCYVNMFARCTSLTSAPVLKAETLADNCYNGMFTGCSNLNSVTMLATNNITATDCLDSWVSGVANSGTFTKAAGMESLPTGISGIPSGWTVQDYVAPGEGY